MKKQHRRVSKKAGLSPGSVVYIGRERAEEVRVKVIDYTVDTLSETADVSIEATGSHKDSASISWLNVIGIHESKIIEQLGQQFGIHPLVLEDIVNTGHRPKMEEAEEYVFIVLKMLHGFTDEGDLRVEQVSVLFGKRWVITLQEHGEDVFEPVRERLRKNVPRTRMMTADYLGYALIDAVVDRYFILLEQLGERIESLDDELSEEPKPEHLDAIRKLKRQLIFLRKAVWPLREVIGGLERSESGLIVDSTRPYIRDLYEHTIQVIDTVETYRDMVSGLLDLYHTGISNRMNEVMKVLTVFATIFIPLGFLAGVYGMNFDTGASPFNLPELGLRFGYVFFWGAAVLIAGGLLWFFRRKRWL